MMNEQDREILIRIDQNLTNMILLQKDHEERLRVLETFKSFSHGVAAVFSILLGFISFEIFGKHQ